MPQHDAVIAINAGTRDMGAMMNLIWDKLVPTLQRDALPADDANHAKMKSKLASLSVPMPNGTAASSMAKTVSGRTFILPKNDSHIDSIALEPGDASDTLIIRAGECESRITCGHGKWERGRTLLARDINVERVDDGEQPIVAGGAWS